MKKKLLVLLITLASTLMPNFASAVAIHTGGEFIYSFYCPLLC
jgi:hypothetical protein